MKIQRPAVSYQQSAVGAVREPPLQKVDLPLLNPPISPFFKGGLRGITLATSYLLLATCLGCGLMEKALMNAFTPNPEITRQKQETARYERATEAIDKANTPEKVKAQERVFVVASQQSHPSLYASVISGLYTEEGRRLAGLAVVAMSSLGVMIWRVSSTWGLPGAFASTVRGIQDFKNKYDKDNPIRAELNASLASRHSGVRVNMARKVKKILGET